MSPTNNFGRAAEGSVPAQGSAISATVCGKETPHVDIVAAGLGDAVKAGVANPVDTLVKTSSVPVTNVQAGGFEHAPLKDGEVPHKPQNVYGAPEA